MLLPFSPDLLADLPGDGFEYVELDLDAVALDLVRSTEFYVPPYNAARRSAALVAEMPRLRVVQTLTAGVDHILPLIPTGVTLCNAAGVHDAATSELAAGMMIAMERRLPALMAAQRRHEWDPQMSQSLADRSVLVVGAGHIARALERRLVGFECSVTLVGRTARDGVRAATELPDLLPRAEIVVLLVPLTGETRHLVDAKFLSLMPDGALLVNVARGAVVVTDDLLAELQSGRLRAALDVTDPEPLPADHPLWDAPGCLLTPHVGGAASSMWPRSYRLVAEQLRRLAGGRPLLNVVARG